LRRRHGWGKELFQKGSAKLAIETFQWARFFFQAQALEKTKEEQVQKFKSRDELLSSFKGNTVWKLERKRLKREGLQLYFSS